MTMLYWSGSQTLAQTEGLSDKLKHGRACSVMPYAVTVTNGLEVTC